MNFLNADSFMKSAGVLKTKYIHSNELGLDGGVFIRELNGSERERVMKDGGKILIFEDGSKEFDLSNVKTGTMARLAVTAMIVPLNEIKFDEAGYPLGEVVGYKQMFPKMKSGDLQGISGDVLDTISRNVRELSGLTKESIDEKKEN